MFVIYAGTVPTWLCMCQVWVMLNMLVLFGNFYMKAYTKKKPTDAAAAGDGAGKLADSGNTKGSAGRATTATSATSATTAATATTAAADADEMAALEKRKSLKCNLKALKGACKKSATSAAVNVATGAEHVSTAVWKPMIFAAGYLTIVRYFGIDTARGTAIPFADVSLALPACMSVLYLLGVKYGMKYMKTREAFAIKDYMFTYNLYQTILNAWCVAAFILEVHALGMAWWGNDIDYSPSAFRLSSLIYIHYNNKVRGRTQCMPCHVCEIWRVLACAGV
jgi:hypothetical protein